MEKDFKNREIVGLIFCGSHNVGPFNQNGVQQLEHEKSFDSGCNWQEYDPTVHIPGYKESQLDNSLHIIENLIEIENPKLAGKNIMVNATLASNSISYSLPSKIIGECRNTEEHSCVRVKELDLDGTKLVQSVDIPDTIKEKLLHKTMRIYFQSDCDLKINEIGTTTVKKIRIRPIVSSLEKNDGKFFDGDGNEWKSYDAYFKQDEIQNLEAGTEIMITGKIIPDPKNQKVTLLISKCSSVEKKNFDVLHVESLKKFCENKTPSEIMDFYTKEFVKFSKIIKRENITISGLLTFFSLSHVQFESELIPGWLKLTIIGDSTTGKSETIKKMIRLLQGGQIVSGETASIVGLAGTATQASNSSWFIEWGPLVLQDKKLLAIDGAHKLGREHWAQLAESERTGKIQIIKAGKGEAYARTRQIKIMNPIGDDFRTTKTMKSFFYPAQAIINNLQIQSIARQDIAVFVSDDVGMEELNVQNGQLNDERLGYLADLLKLVWQQNFKVIFTKDAMQEILLSSLDLQKRFKHDEIPLITNDQKSKMIKISASLAALTCSFNDDFSELTVKKEHVQYVHDFIGEIYHNSCLDIISQNDKDDLDSETVNEIISQVKQSLQKKGVDEDFCKKLLLWCAKKPKYTKEQLKMAFDLTEVNEYRPLNATLINLNLINSPKLTPTTKLIKLVKILLEEKSEDGILSGGVTSDKNDKTSNLITCNTPDTSKQKPPLSHCTLACYNCSTIWKNTTLTFESVEKTHSAGNPGHILHVVKS